MKVSLANKRYEMLSPPTVIGPTEKPNKKLLFIATEIILLKAFITMTNNK
jgi:hypothetical protein